MLVSDGFRVETGVKVTFRAARAVTFRGLRLRAWSMRSCGIWMSQQSQAAETLSSALRFPRVKYHSSGVPVTSKA